LFPLNVLQNQALKEKKKSDPCPPIIGVITFSQIFSSETTMENARPFYYCVEKAMHAPVFSDVHEKIQIYFVAQVHKIFIWYNISKQPVGTTEHTMLCIIITLGLGRFGSLFRQLGSERQQ
jgi:hypothetical protein